MSPAPKRASRDEFTVEATRLLPVSRERVFDCWTNAEHICHWFAPRGFTLHACEADARPGGVFRLTMRAPDGGEHLVRGTYREVVRPERLVIECSATDEDGAPMLDEVIRVTLTVEGNGTRLSLHASAAGTGENAKRALGGMQRGWSETLDRLGERANTGN